MCDGGLCVSVKAVVNAVNHAHAADAAIGGDDGVNDLRARHIVAHQFERISGIDFVHRDWREQLRSLAGVAAVGLQLGEVDNPTSSRRVEVGQVEGHRIRAPSAEDFAIQFGGIVRQYRGGLMTIRADAWGRGIGHEPGGGGGISA